MDIIKTTFLESLFPREKRKDKVEEFINLCQRVMSDNEYSFKFVELSKYAYSLVDSSKDEMSSFVTYVSEDLEGNVR